VSACYAGTFIEPLKDENTIVITASAADRTSFGCSDDNDLTYFGEAFYRDALPNAASLIAAFEAARVAIHERETNEGATPSNPQAHFGKAIEQKLAAMEASRAN
jgi:Peptidase C13 family